MSRAANKLIAAAAGAGDDGGDDNFNLVTLRLDGDGTDQDDNTTFSDSSGNSVSITRNGNVPNGSVSPYGDYWSVYFDGADDLLKATDPSTLYELTGDFTVEFWFMRLGGTASYTPILGIQPSNGQAGLRIAYQSPGTTFRLISGSATYSVNIGTSTVPPLGEWAHFALTRSGSSVKAFIDGTEVGSATSSSWTGTSLELFIGGGRNASSGAITEIPGYYSNVRVVKGTAVYTSAFTPPTDNLTDITNTSFLGCLSNRFEDISSHATTVAVHDGLPKVTRYAPFKSGVERDITTDGGSAYFDLATTYLTYSGGDSSASKFTISFWIYVTGSMDTNGGIYPRVFCSAAGALLIYLRSDDIRIYNGGEKLQTPINRYEWHYFVAQLNGSQWEMWLDGVSKGTNTSTGSNINLSTTNYIGRDATDAGYFGGYLCDLKITEGVEYSDGASFTPPTSPVSSSIGGSFDLTGASYDSKSFSVSSQETSPQGVRFKSDGTKMYVVGNTGDDVMQYSLSTAWDVSTASFDSVTLDVSSQDNTPNGLAFSSDGYELYITGQVNNKIFQYDLSTAWDLSTASYANKSLSTQHTGPIEPFMRSNGTDFYYLDNDDDTVYQYTLSTANDISTASYASKSFDVSSQETTPTGLAFSSDGTKMFVCGQAGDDVNQYTLSTAWDVSTASFSGKVFSFTGETTNPSGIDFKTDGNKLYMISTSGDAVYQYSLGSGTCDVLLNFQDAGIYDLAGMSNFYTVGSCEVDTAVKKYGTGSIKFDGNNDELVNSNGDGSHIFHVADSDFTVEFWANATASTTNVFIANGTLSSAANSNWWIETVSGTLKVYISDGSSYTILSDTQTWSNYSGFTHVAWVNYNGTSSLYIDGTSKDSDTTPSTNDSLVPELYMGATENSFEITGHLDDIRITKGVARYTSNFTPPTAALPKF